MQQAPQATDATSAWLLPAHLGNVRKPSWRAGRSNSFIEAQERKIRDCSAADDCTGNVQRIESTNGFGWKGQTRTANDVGANPQKMPFVACTDQTGAARSRSLLGDLIQRASPNNDSLAFHYGEIGCKNDVRIA
jgi:hypothetical protein